MWTASFFVWDKFDFMMNENYKPSLDISSNNMHTEYLDHKAKTSFIFCDTTPWSPLKAKWRFGGTYCLYLHGRRINQARNQRNIRVGSKESRRQHVPQECLLTFNGLHGLIFRMINLFIITAVKNLIIYKTKTYSDRDFRMTVNSQHNIQSTLLFLVAELRARHD
jgi:hypothetical protein